MPKTVREPIQVYLTDAERAELDRLAGSLGVSRSEVLRRGVSALRTTGPAIGAVGPSGRGRTGDAGTLCGLGTPPGVAVDLPEIFRRTLDPTAAS